MLWVIKNSAKLLLYLVNDIVDVYMIKTGKFKKEISEFTIQDELFEVLDIFRL